VLYKRSFAGYEKALGPSHPHTLTSANNLANLNQVQGNMIGSSALQAQLCRIRKGTRTDHPTTLTSANNLALLYYKQGKYDEAAVLYKRSFAGCEKAEDLITLTRSHLPPTSANLNQVQGKYDERQCSKRSFAGREKALGPITLTRSHLQQPRTSVSSSRQMR